MKKFIVLLLTGLAVVSLCGCNKKETIDNHEVIVDVDMINEYVEDHYGEGFEAKTFDEDNEYVQFMVYDKDDTVHRYVSIEKNFLYQLTHE